ncbi:MULTISPECIES: DUF6625 family protein [unclassified Methylophaga]|jgi:hypothetical protein|uniref:DUF6625 family protein n=1 Tax=unclassified Methylophaga TaxID=2629249 RepID=UPI000C66A278|nr:MULTISPECIES: DUF6625 family protein [unclassified Methylophaga]MAL50745.1 hypothetical protein [Methylophaga sp.]MBP23960.1 hypothetical protein [Methylophaga sp.]HAD31294.1 hypothetical protein [Methylophaga sp.]HCC80284.1 hypothetical protein [Methylophaga sp.]|tara:strand:- start:5458 stop:6381 length:924 start_codon:yes stop_codon:yes gene_type:complete
MQHQKIIKIIPYFGQWPEWFELYLLSCMHNPDIDWLFYTDCQIPEKSPRNVRFVNISFLDYKKLISERLGINFSSPAPFKLCDVRPAYGFVHQDEIDSYDFYAYGDIDIIYGQIRQFITDEMLDRYDVIGTHNRRLSGHFSLFRNTEQNRQAFRKIPDWQKLMEMDEHIGLDESKFSKLFVRHKNHPLWLRKLWSYSSRYQRRVLYKEQFSTVLSPIKWIDGSSEHPQQWFWKDGHLTNDRDNREFMYLHFMNWKSNRWLPKNLRDAPAAWTSLDKLVQIDIEQARKNGFQISPQGFTPINPGKLKG